MSATKQMRRNLGVQDTEFLERDSRVQQLEAYDQRVKAYCDRELVHAHYVENDETSVANAERQRGNPLNWRKLEEWLIRVAPQLRVLPHPWKDNIANIYQVKEEPPWVQDPVTGRWGGQQTHQVCAINRQMPEWTIMTRKAVDQPQNEGYVDPDYTVKSTDVPWNVGARGWREVLAILLRRHLVTVPQVEAFVKDHGSSQQRASWHGMLNERRTAL